MKSDPRTETALAHEVAWQTVEASTGEHECSSCSAAIPRFAGCFLAWLGGELKWVACGVRCRRAICVSAGIPS